MGKKRYVEPEFKTYDSAFDSLKARLNPSGPKSSSDYLGEAMSPTFRGYNTGYGKSSYDKNLNWDAEVDPNDVRGSVNEHRAREQGWGMTVLSGLGRTVVKGGVEAAKLIPVLGGAVIGAAGQVGDLVTGRDDTDFLDTTFNNAAVRALDTVNEDLKDSVLPVYVKRAVQDGDLMAKLGSIEFWATDGADGLGFALGMMAPGALISKIGLGAKMLNSSRKLSNIMGIAGKTDEAVDILSKIGAAGKKIDNTIAVTANTFAEAGAEAKGFSDNFERTRNQYVPKKTEALYKQYLNEQGLLAEPEMIQGKMQAIQTPDGKSQMFSVGLIPNPKLVALREKAVADAEQDFNIQKAAGARNVFVANTALLVVPNALMHNALFGSKVAKKMADPAKAGWKGIAERVNKAGQRYGTALVSEGIVEEGGQTTTEGFFADKASRGELSKDFFSYKAKDFFSKENLDTVSDDAKEFAKKYVSTLGTTEGQTAVVLGAVFGGMMTSTFGRIQDKSDRKQSDKVRSNVKIKDDIYNIIRENDVYMEDPANPGEPLFEKDDDDNDTNVRKVDLVKASKVASAYATLGVKAKEYQEALANNDTAKLEELHNEAKTSVAMNAAIQGELGVAGLKEHLDSVTKELDPEKYSEEDIKDIKSRNLQLIDRANHLVKINEKFDDFAPDLINLTSIPGMTQTKAVAYRNMLQRQYLTAKDNVFTASTKIKDLEKQRKDTYREIEDEAIYNVTGKSKPTLKDKGIDLFSNIKNLRSKLTNVIDPTFEFSEESKKLQEKLLNASEEEKRINDEIENLINSNPEIVDIDSQLKDLNETVGQNKSTLAKIWQAGKSQENLDDIIDFVKSETKLENELNVESQESIENVIEKLSTYDENQIDQLLPYFYSLSKELQDNPVVLQLFKDKKAELQAILDTKKQGEVPTDTELEGSPETPPVDNTSDEEVANTFSNNEAKGGSKVISTYYYNPTAEPVNALKNGQKIIGTNGEEFISDEFIDYERNGLNKVGDEVSFEIDGTNADTADIKVITTDKTTGKKVFSFLSKLPKGGEALAYYNNHIRPLRIKLIEALNSGIPISEIKSSIIAQLPGGIKVEPQFSDSEGNPMTPENSILDLDIFRDMREKGDDASILKYFHNNTYYVNKKGQMLNSITGNPHPGTAGKTFAGRGEVFLMIKKANGDDFLLKLNFKRIDNVKAEIIYEMFRSLSKYSKDISNPTAIQTMNIEEFFNEIEKDNDNSENLKNIRKILKDEYDVIKSAYKDKGLHTVEKLLDMLVYQKSDDPKTRIRFEADGTLVLGTLSTMSENATILTPDNLNAREHKDMFIEYLKHKRHNVIITMDLKINFKSKAYTSYLVTNDILTTNAVVNEYGSDNKLITRNPTFQGNANIYVSHNIVDSKNKPIGEVNRNVPAPPLPTSLKDVTVENYIDNPTITNQVDKVLTENGYTDHLSEDVDYSGLMSAVNKYNEIINSVPTESTTTTTSSTGIVMTKELLQSNRELFVSVLKKVNSLGLSNIKTPEDYANAFNEFTEMDKMEILKICNL